LSAGTSQPAGSAPSPKPTFIGRLKRFWQRVSDGLELNQLWSQFQADARASYRLYSRDVDSRGPEGLSRGKRFRHVTRQFFWAILEKLSPARRVLLLAALAMIIFNPELAWHNDEGTHLFSLDFRLYGGLLIFVLLILEVADRVVMKRDLQIAREIQMWLLPTHPPTVPGLEIAFATRPANTVAGDYYDVFPRPTGDAGADHAGFLMVVADVAGKSIPAALLMATFQASLKTLSSTRSSLAQLIAGMNRYACTNSQGGLRFTTAFLAEYDPSSRTLTYINAGHNQPILRRSSGTIERLGEGGLPLGIREEAVYESGKAQLESGDWLVIFTDGLVEAINQGEEEYGEERVISIVHAAGNLAPSKLLSRIMVDLDFFVGSTPQHDDVTCMLLRVV
jgi:phosphoserine phosphatase RsbU/P